MATASLSHVLARLRNILGRQAVGEQSDGHLLDLFLAQRDESAFELLMRRHGPMVLGVCRRILGNSHDAEDTFQATFLVLVRRGDSIRPRGQVGNWLYGVAYRTALEARRAAARRRRKEACAMSPSRSTEDIGAELRPVIDQELSRLPERYRLPLVLCDLEGLTRKEAARQLGWAEGTMSSRLSRARQLLARRLKRHGFALSAAALTGTLAEGAVPAAVPAPLVVSTIQAAVRMAAGQTAAGLVGADVVALVEKVVRTMGMMKLRWAVALVLGISLAGGTTYYGLAGQPPCANESKAAEPAGPILVRAEVAADKNEAADDEEPAVSVKEMPPVIVRTVPEAGDTGVEADKVTEIRVTFSKKMRDKSWSWSSISNTTFPKVAGEIHYDKDRRTCILPVKLEPGKTYVLWLNSEKFVNFKDAGGRSAVPYLLVFETKAEKKGPPRP